jgi:hypothetical protein
VRRLDRLRPYERRYFLIERQFHFDPAVLRPRRHAFLAGYWQSERYFDAIADRLRGELTPRQPPDPVNAALLAEIEAAEAVSVHVRRGDYVDHPDIHPLMPVEYYRAAVDAVRARTRDPRFFIFSDEPDRAGALLSWLSPATVVSHNGAERDSEDLRLMRHCRHHIIANSTFSWWGAWLCPHADKVVIAPRRWFADAFPHSTADLLPPRWLRIGA